MPKTYPQSPPTAHFRTKIFHPNVDQSTGAICVETLKRDWRPQLTLRDILVTISCLLIYPNPSSALNAEAGMMIEEDFNAFEKRAALWAKMHAAIPSDMKPMVDEARRRGEVVHKSQISAKGKGKRRVGADGVGKSFTEAENSKECGERPTNGKPNTLVSSSDPVQSANNREQQGLGLLTSIQSIQTVVDMDIDSTPIQPPPPRRTRKRYAFDSPQDLKPLPSTNSFAHQPATPTPAIPLARERLERQVPITPTLPNTKRLRLSPPSPVVVQEEKKRSNTQHFYQQRHRSDNTSSSVVIETSTSCPVDLGSDVKSWVTWYTRLPPSPLQTRSAKLAREKADRRRMEAAGHDIKKWNSGAFGVRKGMWRL